ncbi:MAG: mismatch-specific DNA-glycosylase [Actinobacteria bacterium]|nr:mismatch-specific DNA-glycosylase [Actinomycetota bacterium]
MATRFSRTELEGYRDATVPDLLPDDLRLLFVGINPSLMTAATGTHFAHPGNRFYRALHGAGVTDRLLDWGGGLPAEDEQHLRDRGVGITNIVARATARADELDDDEFRAGAEALRQRIRRWRPPVVAFVGVTAFRIGFGRRAAVRGRQEERLEGAVVHVLGNPSGLNAHDTVETLAASYREAARDAGIV